MMTRSIALIVTMALFLVPTLQAADPILLQYKFAPKEVLKYKLTMNTEAKFQTPDGSSRNNTMASNMELSQELIEKKADGGYRIAVTITKADQKVDGKPAQLQVAIGQALLLTMKPNGQIVEGAADLPTGGSQPQMQMVFPEKPVAEKESWSQVAKIQQPIPMETTTKYTVETLAGDLPGYDGKVAVLKSTMGMANQKTTTGEAVTSKTDGKIWFDAAKGRIVQSKAESTFHIAIPINLQGVLPPQSKVNIDFKVSIDIGLAK